MKSYRILLPAFTLAVLALPALTGCSEDPEMPPMIVPTAPDADKVNTTILDLKTAYWSTDKNYVATVGTTDEGEHIYVKGRVVSSDESGNIYKSVIIADSTASLTIAVNATKLYQTYQFGQELVIDMTGLKLGGYNGLMQLGGEGTYNGSPSMTFMDSETFKAHAQQNGLSNPALVDTLVTTIAETTAAKASTQSLISWQSRLIRLDEVKFTEPGQLFAPDANANRYVTDKAGNQMLVRCSAYASFAKDTIPSGRGSLVGILSFYGSDWQMLMIDAESLIDFHPVEGDDDPVVIPSDGGTKAEPYTVAQVLALGSPGSTAWIGGYIVGSIPDKYFDGANIGTADASNTNFILADSPSETDLDNCIAVALPAAMRPALSLANVPGNLGKLIKMQGTLTNYFGKPGLKDVTEYELEGTENPEPQPGEGDVVSELDCTFEGVTAISQLPGWTSVTPKGNKSWYFTSFQDNYYAAITAYKGTSTDGYEAWLITPALDVAAMAEKVFSFESQAAYSGNDEFKVFVLSAADPAKATLTELPAKIATAPASGYSGFESSGQLDLSAFANDTIYVGFRYTAPAGSNFHTYCIDNVVAGKK